MAIAAPIPVFASEVPTSRRVFDWLAIAPGKEWLDVGCGTGALSGCILAEALPSRLEGIDPSAGFLEHARSRVKDSRANFRVADARETGFPEATFDVVVSGLVLNFVPQPGKAVAEMRRVARPGGCVAAYVWDYAEGMQVLRHFWNAATSVDPAAAELDEARRFPLCRPDPLHALWTQAGLTQVRVTPLVVPTPFADVTDLWSPFLAGQGPAGTYVTGLTPDQRDRLRTALARSVPHDPEGTITLSARAWVVRGVRA